MLGLALAAAGYGYSFYHFHAHGWLPRLVDRGMIQRRQPWLFAAGLTALILALLSPIDVMADMLLSSHMLQHILLIMVVPPLLLLGLPAPFTRRLIVETRSRSLLKWLTAPIFAFLLYNANLLAWHVPALYEAALSNEWIHVLEHALFFYAALFFWWRVIDPTRGWFPLWHWPPAKWLFLIVAAPPSYVLGSILWAHDQVLYPHYLHVPRLWGLSALADQQIAGLLMWGQGWMFVMVSMIVFFSWYNPELEQA